MGRAAQGPGRWRAGASRLTPFARRRDRWRDRWRLTCGRIRECGWEHSERWRPRWLRRRSCSSLGIGAPFEKDQEPQSAQWIQAVVQRGEWLLPRDDYSGIDRKPPLVLLAVGAGREGRRRARGRGQRAFRRVGGGRPARGRSDALERCVHRRGHRMARARVRAGHLRFRFARDARPHRHAALCFCSSRRGGASICCWRRAARAPCRLPAACCWDWRY